MKRSFLTTAFALLAMTIVFNSCEDEEKFDFPYDGIKLLVKDGAVISNMSSIVQDTFCYRQNWKYDVTSVCIGTSPDNCINIGSVDVIPYTKYYWYVEAYDNETGLSANSEIRAFYYVPIPNNIEIHNVNGDWATVIKWEHNDAFEGGSVTMTPDKDCNYDKAPIEVPVGQDSCYISAGDLSNQKYQIYHNWWDEANGKYYEPVVYDYKLTLNCNIDGELIPVSTSIKGIFLNTDGYVADSLFNVYRYAKIGNRTWMLDDLRFKMDVKTIDRRYSNEHYYRQITLESGLEMVVYSSEAYPLMKEYMIPKGFHLATNEDWEDLETHFGVEPYNIETHPYSKGKKMPIAGELSQYLYDTITQLSRWVLDPVIIDDIRYIDSVYVGKNTLIREYLISDNEWIDNNDPTKRLTGYGSGFNAHPVGIIDDTWETLGNSDSKIGYGAFFMTSTFYDNDKQYLARVLASAYNGIGRIRVVANKGSQFFLYRCVKDE